ncbi:MAG: class II aldolase/adducin family protein [Anaerolineaceae bacterium]|nr:class II aldolase/adducin family protein [Anaerolineaceae bacterium]
MEKIEQCRLALLAAAQELTQKGYLSATGGNLSARVPEENMMVITPSNYSYMKMTPEDICVLDLNLNPIAGERKPSIESGMHAAIYLTRPDVNAVIHTHQAYPSTLAIIGKPIPPLFDEQVVFLGDAVEIIPYAPSGSNELRDLVAKQTRSGNNAYLMANHGALLLGNNLERAMFNAAVLEKCAVAYLLALCSQEKVSTLPAEALELSYTRLHEDYQKLFSK